MTKPLVLVWFTGMTMTKCSPEEEIFIKKLALTIGREVGSPSIRTECHAAPEDELKVHRWAKYKEETGVSNNDTCNVADVEKDLERSAGDLYKTIRSDNVYLFCGTSNGCIPAYEFARHYAKENIVIGCILHNGCPAMSNTEFGKKRPWVPFPILMLLGKEDYLWKNHLNTYSVAYVLEAAVLPFNGRHGDLPPVDACGDAFLGVMKAHHAQPPKKEWWSSSSLSTSSEETPSEQTPPQKLSHIGRGKGKKIKGGKKVKKSGAKRS